MSDSSLDARPHDDAPTVPHDAAVAQITGGLLGALYEQMPQGVVVQDADGRVLAANAAAARALGLGEAALYGRIATPAGWGAVDEEGRPLADDAHPTAVALRTGRPVVDRMLGVRRAGAHDTRWLRVSAIPRLPDEGAAPERVYTVLTDVTAEGEDARHARFLADAARRLMETLEIERTLEQVATLAVPLLADWCAVDVLEAGTIRRVAVHHADPAKRALAAELQRRFPAQAGDRGGVASLLRDGREVVITDAEDALAAIAPDDEHRRLARTLGIRELAILPLAVQGRVIGALSLVSAEPGHTVDARTLHTARELAGRAAVALDHARLFAETRAQNHELETRRQMLEEQAVELEMTNAQLQEQQVELEVTNQQLQEQQVELELQAEELQATTDQLAQHVEQLDAARLAAERARRVAEEANAAKSQFLAAMSHELRTPLNAITGYVDLLALGVRGAISDTQQDDLARIRRSGDHLLRLINDILQFAKLEAGQLEFRVGPVPLGETLRELEALVAPQMRARQLTFTIDVDEGAPAARADRDKLQQVVLNLLSNAIKATPAGGAVRLHARGSDDGTRAIVSVTDTGCGIPAEKVPTIFDPFVQVDRQLNRPGEGIGLGLAISRDLARTMAGELSVTSEVGKGSTFVLELPAA